MQNINIPPYGQVDPSSVIIHNDAARLQQMQNSYDKLCSIVNNHSIVSHKSANQSGAWHEPTVVTPVQHHLSNQVNNLTTFGGDYDRHSG